MRPPTGTSWQSPKNRRAHVEIAPLHMVPLALAAIERGETVTADRFAGLSADNFNQELACGIVELLFGRTRPPRSWAAIIEESLPLPTRLRSLAGELLRLAPSRRDPACCHVEKDRIASEIRKAAREVDWTHLKPAAAPASCARSPRHAINRPPVIETAVRRAPGAGRAPVLIGAAPRPGTAGHRLRLPTGDLFEKAADRIDLG
jgi:hypothetical protein